ncbi:HupE/UreJ family protein [Photobacterium marinum]|nr:HupE/UreJ family protein [Photobacterium marinum]
MTRLEFNCSGKQGISRMVATLGALGTSGSVWAHDSGASLAGGDVSDRLISAFYSGIIHPLTGFDHLVMLIGIGLIAAQYKKLRTNNSGLGPILMALICMLVGLGMGAFAGEVNGVEPMIIGSVFVVAITALSLNRFSVSKHRVLSLLPAIAAMMLIFHGWAHGAEASGQSLLAFAPGMLVGAGFLSSVGFMLGRVMVPGWQGVFLGASGLVLAVTG